MSVFTTRWIVAYSVFACIVLASCTPNDGQSGAAPAASTVAPDSLRILYTCDTRGHISPCNCSAGVAGGLARRKTFVTQQSQGDVLLVDAGNLTAGTRAWELLELEYILKGYESIGYHAVNVGKREAELPLATLKDVGARHPLFVSANVGDADGNLLFPPYRVVTLKSGYRVAVLGVVDHALQPDEIGQGLRVSAPEEALAKAIPKAKSESDLLVLLAFVDEAKLRTLAERFFEIAVIVGGDVAQPSGEPEMVNKTVVVYNTDKGKAVGTLDLRFVGGQYIADANTIETLLENVPDDAGIAALVKDLQREQVDNNYPATKDDANGLTSISGGSQ